jgi:hypothetical protein
MCTRVTLAEVKKLQKAAGILKEGEDYSLEEMLNEKAPFHVTDEFCKERYGSLNRVAYACGANTQHPELQFCWPASAPMDICCNDNAAPKGSKMYAGVVPCSPAQRQMYENTDINEAPSPCPPMPDGTKLIPYSIGNGPNDFVCLPANTVMKRKNGTVLKPKTNATVPPAPRFGAQPLTK